MNNIKSQLFILILFLATNAVGQDFPEAVSNWINAHPEATVHSWRRFELFGGAALYRIKNDVEYVVVDDLGDEVVDAFEVIDENRELRHAALGGMTDYLNSEILANPGGLFLVSISSRRMRPPDYERSINQEQFDAQRPDIVEFVANSLNPILDALAGAQATPEYVSATAPFVVARLTSMQIHAIKMDSSIDVIDIFHESATNYDGDNFTAGVVTDLAPLHATVVGAGELVVTVESGRVRSGASPAEPYNLMWQSGQTLGASINRDNSCGLFDDHASWVAGFISAQDPSNGDLTGAPSARVVVANTCIGLGDGDSLLERFKAADDVTMFGVDKNDAPVFTRLMNHSYGDDEAIRLWGGGGWLRALDFRVKYFLQTETLACGNHGEIGGITACRSYNSINVGAYDDKGTLNWVDDGYFQRYPGAFPIVEKTGAWLNDNVVGSDRELPELAAPGVLLRSTEQTAGTAPHPNRLQVGPDRHSGTSFAAPQIAGIGALVHEKDSTVKWAPVAMKALLLSTSVHGVAGDAPPDFGLTKVGGRYADDLRVGVGGAWGGAVAEVLEQASGRLQVFDTVNSFWNSSSAGGWRYLNNSYPVFVPTFSTGKSHARVAISWYGESSCRMCTMTDIPQMNGETWFGEFWGLPSDIDLLVTDAYGNVVGHSVSFDNNYEVVQFETAGRPQPFRVHIKAFEGGTIKNETIALSWFAWDP